MADKKKVYTGTGRRKTSVARVRLTPGSGKITINGRDVNEYFPYPTLVMDLTQPLDVTLLRFVPDGIPKVAYAASLSCPYIPDGLNDLYFSSISRFDAISIREKDSLSLFPPQLKDRIRVVEDPTLLLSSNEWRDLLDIRPEKDGTIFCYFLGGEVKDGKSAKRISKILGMPISAATYAYDYGHVDIEYHDMGPREFVQHIMNFSFIHLFMYSTGSGLSP